MEIIKSIFEYCQNKLFLDVSRTAQKTVFKMKIYSKTADDKWVTSAPMNGTCEAKDKSGKTMVVVHENYKQYGACAYHCLTMKKEHKDMKMK